MELSISTPALLFPAISVLILAYTNRFIAISKLTRELHNRYRQNSNEVLEAQLITLKRRIGIIRYMQAIGVLGFLSCILCMYFVFANLSQIANVIFVVALTLIGLSLILSFFEIYISSHVLMIQLNEDIQHKSNMFKK